MSILLAEPLSQKVERLAKKHGYPSVEDYLTDLLQREEHDGSPFVGREAEVEAALLKSLQSGPATPMTRADWDELKRRALASSHDSDNP